MRENTEGEYVGAGGLAHAGTGHDLGIEVAVHSRRVIERAAHHAFALAASRRGRLSLVTKSNAMRYGYPLWDRVVREVAEEHPDVEVEVVLVDAMAARMIQAPRSLDVLLAGNLFGDILSDLGGGAGRRHGHRPQRQHPPRPRRPRHLRAGARLGPRHRRPGVANPVACLLSGAMLLDDLGHDEAAARVRAAVAAALLDPDHHTADLGGRATTTELGSTVLRELEEAQ